MKQLQSDNVNSELEQARAELIQMSESGQAAKAAQSIADKLILAKLQDTLNEMRAARPSERGDKSRHYAVCITELEKAYAYFSTFIN